MTRIDTLRLKFLGHLERSAQNSVSVLLHEAIVLCMDIMLRCSKKEDKRALTVASHCCETMGNRWKFGYAIGKDHNAAIDNMLGTYVSHTNFFLMTVTMLNPDVPSAWMSLQSAKLAEITQSGYQIISNSSIFDGRIVFHFASSFEFLHPYNVVSPIALRLNVFFLFFLPVCIGLIALTYVFGSSIMKMIQWVRNLCDKYRTRRYLPIYYTTLYKESERPSGIFHSSLYIKIYEREPEDTIIYFTQEGIESFTRLVNSWLARGEERYTTDTSVLILNTIINRTASYDYEASKELIASVMAYCSLYVSSRKRGQRGITREHMPSLLCITTTVALKYIIDEAALDDELSWCMRPEVLHAAELEFLDAIEYRLYIRDIESTIEYAHVEGLTLEMDSMSDLICI
ncbi:hypothetical protein PROFUN_04205 [Planoprotostelium fungivorum]|uniref:Uncharacterized protein n=1 Tax=Planoprotostelium fungivorum TaxID=1890364 RepID=A0A2P6NVX1_9EUKA|nr:hypothetical protein PROFUN_04205 [Planoprotostelium fungivorum]